MKCFNHPNTDAVGLCQSCGRGLCRDCVTEVGLSCSCKGQCEAIVAAKNELVERGRTAYQKSSAMQLRSGILIVLLGGLFLFFGVASLGGERSTFNYFLLGAGALFATLGLSSIYSAIRLKQK